jgi:fructokinase
MHGTRDVSDGAPLTVAALGEALFDCAPDRTTLGGAPLNFIVHLQQLLAAKGGESYLVSRVGNDALGREVIESVNSRGVSTNFIQVDPQRPTGQVQVEFSLSGEPNYHIAENAAWDHIVFEPSMDRLASTCHAVYFGTLAQRNLPSREALRQFLAAAPKAIKVLDVNLRQRYFTPEVLQSSLSLANIVKLNEEELVAIAALLPDQVQETGTVDDARSLLEEFDLDIVALTRGARGTVFYTPAERIEREAPKVLVAEGADDVGAGDACCAGLVYGLLMKWPLERTLQFANQMGAYLASQPGGTPQLSKQLLAYAASESSKASASDNS